VGGQNIQQIGQNPMNQNVQTTGNPKVKYLVLGIVVFLGFLLFGLGGYYFGKQSTNSYQDSKKTANQPLPSPTTTEADEAADWRVYTNDKYGFEVKYDPESSPTEQVGTEDTGQFTYLLLVKFGTNPLKFPHGYAITVNKQRSLNDYRTELIGHSTDKIDSEKEITTNDNTWTKLNYQIFLTTDYIPVTTAVLSQSGYSFAITAATLDTDQILSTFKFRIKYTDLSELKTADVLVQDGSYYGPPFDPDLYQLEIGQSNHLFAKSDTINLKQYLGKRIKVSYREVKGIVMGEQQLVIVESVD